MIDGALLTRNLLRLYRARTEQDDILGTAWYPAAHHIVCKWSDTYGYSIATVACVIAAISPHCPWERNLIIADDILAGQPASIGGGIRANIRKAEHIRDDRAGSTLSYFPCGPKVNSFSANLKGNYDEVTVDTHAIQAAVNDVQTNLSLKWHRYTIFAAAYSRAATKANREPAEFQAILWHTWKRLHPRASKIQERKQWHVCGELEGD